MRLAVEAVPDVGGGHEQRKGVLLLGVQQATLHELLDLPHPLLLVTATQNSGFQIWAQMDVVKIARHSTCVCILSMTEGTLEADLQHWDKLCSPRLMKILGDMLNHMHILFAFRPRLHCIRYLTL